jgi:hypothetical protein
MRRYPLLITLGIMSAMLCAAFSSPSPAQSKGKPKTQPKTQPKQGPGSKDAPAAKDLEFHELAKQRALDRAQIAVQNTQEMKTRDDGVVALKKLTAETTQTQAKMWLEVKQIFEDKIANLPAGDRARMQKLFQNQGAVRTQLQKESLAKQKTYLANGSVLKGFPETQPVDAKQHQMLLSQVASYQNTLTKPGIKVDAYGRPVNPSQVTKNASAIPPGGMGLFGSMSNAVSVGSSQGGFVNSAATMSGGSPSGSVANAGSHVSALSIPPALGQGAAQGAPGQGFGGGGNLGYSPNLGAVLIPNTTAAMPSSISPGVVPEVGGGYQIVQTLPDLAGSNYERRTAVGSEALLVEGSEAAASIAQSTRFVRFTNGTDKKAKFFIHYETIDTEGKRLWLPPKEDGYSYAASVEVGAGQSVDLKEGDWRVNAARARIWAVTEDREWARYKHIDLWLVPEVDERGEHSYRAPFPETYSYTIGS